MGARDEVWRKPLSGGFRVLQVACVATGAVGLLALAGTPVDSWFRTGVGAAVGVLMVVLLIWTAWFGLGWAYLGVRGGQVRVGFSPLVWARHSFPVEAVATVDSVDVNVLDHGGKLVGGDPNREGLLVSTGGREAVRLELWDGRTYLVTLRRSDEVVNRLRELLGEGT